MVHQFDDEPEPTPSQTLRIPWDEARLRRTVRREEWVGCWRTGASGYLEFFRNGDARQGGYGGTISWEWIDPRVVRIRHRPGHGEEMVTEHRVIRFDGKTMWTWCKSLDGPAAGVELSAHLFRASRPKSWR
jgi:hypothetical protein